MNIVIFFMTKPSVWVMGLPSAQAILLKVWDASRDISGV